MMLDYGKVGMLVPPGDTGALVDAIRRSFSGSPEILHQVEMAQARVRELYTVERMRSSVAALVGQVAAER